MGLKVLLSLLQLLVQKSEVFDLDLVNRSESRTSLFIFIF